VPSSLRHCRGQTRPWQRGRGVVREKVVRGRRRWQSDGRGWGPYLPLLGNHFLPGPVGSGWCMGSSGGGLVEFGPWMVLAQVAMPAATGMPLATWALTIQGCGWGDWNEASVCVWGVGLSLSRAHPAVVSPTVLPLTLEHVV
jgi:hypothetical protein